MDHLPVVPSATVPGLETVPYVCKKSYDGGPFLTYPAREGRPEIVPDAGNEGKAFLWELEMSHPTPNKEFEAFCQTWLFFGLIHELLGKICTPADFLRPGKDGDSSTISTSQLPALVDRWVLDVQDGSSDVTYEHVAKCLRLTHISLVATGPDFDLSVKFCIASVGEFFEYAANRAFRIGNLVLETKCPASWCMPLGDIIITELLARSGWCPSQIEILVRSPPSLQSLYFFASMHESVSVGRHDQCDTLKCVAYQTDFKNYATQHVRKLCKCEEVCVDKSRLITLVTTGALPLLRIRQAEDLDQLTVELVPSQPGSRYLALSHVWADGLGNTKANALPRCQLHQLADLTQSLSEKLSPDNSQSELFLWCDTLCCPVSPEDAKHRVLEQMKDIYKQATGVLVLDASIRLYNREAMRPEEACASILISGWMRRLWTFQEGAFPGDKGQLWFQFRHGAVNFSTLWQELVGVFNNDWDRKGLATELVGRLRFLRNFFHPEVVADLAMVDTALRHRLVSVSSDEPLLIGTLLGLDIATILSGSDKTRIHRMWSLMPAAIHGIPKSLLFRLGPRLMEDGYRWAPSTLLHYELTNETLARSRNGDDKGTPTEHGLMVRLSGYHISFPKRPRGLLVNPRNLMGDRDILYMRDDEASWHAARRRWPNADGDYLSNDTLSDAILRSPTNLWITYLEIESQARVDNFAQTTIALLTTLTHESDEVKYVHSYMHIHVFRYRESRCEMLEAAYRCAQKLVESAPAQRLADMSEDDINAGSPEYKAAFDSLESEIQRLAASGQYDRALAIARERSSQDDDMLLEVFMWFVKLMVQGQYAIMGPRTPDSQQWCVD